MKKKLATIASIITAATLIPLTALGASVELYCTSLVSDGSLISYWRLEDTTDYKGTNTLVNNGSIAFNPAKFNNGGDFGAGNNSKTFSVSGGLAGGVNPGNSNWSMTFWVNNYSAPTSTSQYFTYFDWRNANGYQIFSYWNNGGLQLAPNCNGTINNPSVDLGIGAWHNIAITNANGGLITYFVDGLQVATGTCTTNNQPAEFFMGDSAGGSTYARAIIDDWAFFSSTLSSTTVSQLYNGTLGSSGLCGGAPTRRKIIQVSMDVPKQTHVIEA